MLAWLSLWGKVQTCIWPSWCHCHSLSLASVKSRLVLLFWYRLIWVVLDKGPLNVCHVVGKDDYAVALTDPWSRAACFLVTAAVDCCGSLDAGFISLLHCLERDLTWLLIGRCSLTRSLCLISFIVERSWCLLFAVYIARMRPAFVSVVSQWYCGFFSLFCQILCYYWYKRVDLILHWIPENFCCVAWLN